MIGLDKLSQFDQVLFACLIFPPFQMTNKYAKNDLVGWGTEFDLSHPRPIGFHCDHQILFIFLYDQPRVIGLDKLVGFGYSYRHIYNFEKHLVNQPKTTRLDKLIKFENDVFHSSKLRCKHFSCNGTH